MKKIMLLTNSFPPINSPATNRYVSFAKYLSEFGYQVIVVTPKWTESSRNYLEQITGFTTNSDLNKELPISDYRVEPVVFSGREELGNNKLEKLTAKLCLNTSSYLLGNLKEKMMEKVIGICEEEKIDIIISGGLPDYLSDVSNKVATKYNIPWIADYRDVIGQVPISSSSYINYHVQKISRFLHVRRDNKITKPATVKTAAVQRIVDILSSRGSSNVQLVMNGFDPKDFDFKRSDVNCDKFTIIHGGTIYPFQEPDIFIKGLELFLYSNPKLSSQVTVKFFGQSSSYIQSFVKSFAFPEVFKFSGYVERKFLLKEMKNSDMILFLSVQEKGITTSKIYECMASEVPILSVPGDGDITSEMIEKSNSGLIAETAEQVKICLETWFSEWEVNGFLASNVDLKYVNQFSRKEQAKQLVEIIETI